MSRKKLEPMLIVPDIHIPYHDKKAVGLMMRVAKDLKPKHLILLGDAIDNYSVSSHSKDPNRVRMLDEEVSALNAELDKFDALNAKHKVFISGNHENRLERYLQDKAPELYNLVKIPELFKLKQRGWEYIPYKDHKELGKIHITHDVGHAGRGSVFQNLDTYQHSVITGHTHKLCYVVEGNAVGEQKLSAQFGWLGDVTQVDYMHKAKALKNWALGFGVGYYDPSSGYSYLTPVPIVKYTCVVNGKFYKA
jgi:predicted phosphodiesterase